MWKNVQHPPPAFDPLEQKYVNDELQQQSDFSSNRLQKVLDLIAQNRRQVRLINSDLLNVASLEKNAATIRDRIDERRAAIGSLMSLEGTLFRSGQRAFIKRIQERQLTLADRNAIDEADAQSKEASASRAKAQLLALKRRALIEIVKLRSFGHAMVEERNELGHTWFQRAIMYNNNELLRNVSEFAPQGGTLKEALSNAIGTGNVGLARELVRMGAEIYRSPNESSLLSLADDFGERHISALLVRNGDFIRVPWGDPTVQSETKIANLLRNHLHRVQSFASTSPSSYDQRNLNLLSNRIESVARGVSSASKSSDL
jgi:hypothetical protein